MGCGSPVLLALTSVFFSPRRIDLTLARRPGLVTDSVTEVVSTVRRLFVVTDRLIPKLDRGGDLRSDPAAGDLTLVARASEALVGVMMDAIVNERGIPGASFPAVVGRGKKLQSREAGR